MTDAPGPDPFGTARLRAAVLESWSTSPTRFREDANAEEDLLLGGYRDAWFVELAQNAADAATAAVVPGRLLVRFVDAELRVANTGAPLDAAGVSALASLRASAKRDDAGAVGRFGVGFAAVLAVSREPRIVAGPGSGVRFSAAATAAAVGQLSGPAAELARRDGQLPVLRLVWPVDDDEEPPPAGYDTEVRLPLLPGLDPEELLGAARAQAPDLLLALPDLVEVDVAGTVLRREAAGPAAGPAAAVRVGDQRWLLATAAGRLADAEAGSQATEQRHRRDWALTWALPLGDNGPVPYPPDAGEVVHAPTASAERLSLPARLIATVPLEADRRRVRDTAATQRVLAAAGPAYLDLLCTVDPGHRAALVPAPGFPASEVDGTVRAAVLATLRTAAWLPGAGGADLVPARAEWLDVPGAPGLAALLAEVDEFAALADPDAVACCPPAVLGELGVRRLGAAELADRLLGLRRPGAWWQAVYAALAPAAEAVPGLLDELRALPVPLASGRTVAGPASVLLPDAGSVAALDALDLPGLHVADSDAVHPLLRRLGAVPAEPGALLERAALREAVERSVDDAEAGLDTGPLAEAVLELATRLDPGQLGTHRWLGALALPDADGNPARADELVLPDAALRPLLAPDAPVGVCDPALAGRARAALVAVGVLDGFALVTDPEPHGPDHDLHDEDLWWDDLDVPPARFVAVRDLDLVDDTAWPAALALLAADRETRSAVLTDGYTRWWLARNVLLGGRPPGHWRLPSATAAAALYEPAPADVDEAVLAAIGVRAGLSVADTADAAELLDRLADPARRPDPALVVAAYTELGAAVADGRVDPGELDLPQRVRVLDGEVVDVDDVVVLDAPWLTAVLPPAELVAGGAPEPLARLLDLPLATEIVDAEVVDSAHRTVGWSALAEVVVACHTLGLPVPDGELVLHDELLIDIRRPASARRAVPAWPDRYGRWHAADPVRALLGLLAAPAQAPGADG